MLPRSRVGDVLQAIYDTEWPIRLEYLWDGGWVWVLVGRNDTTAEVTFPRVWTDDQLDGKQTVLCMSEFIKDQFERIPSIEKDWVARGNEKTIEDAVFCLATAIADETPDSEFSRQWKAGEWQDCQTK